MDAKTYYDKALRRYNEDETDLRSPDDFAIDCMADFAREMNGQLMPEPRVGQRLTNQDVFRTVCGCVKWYNGLMSVQSATQFKRQFLKGRVSQKRLEYIFGKHGYKRVETIWVKK